MSFEDEFSDWAEHPVQVATYEGAGAWGETWADPVSVDAWYEHKNRLVVTSDGKTVTSGTTVYAGPSYAPLFRVNSEVTLPNADPAQGASKVLAVGTFPGDDSHIEVYLQ